MGIPRDAIADVLRRRLELEGFMRAAWLGGSAAFDRLDEFSDIDVQFDVTAGMVSRGLEAVEAVLSSIGSIEYKWVVPLPTWHGHAQRFHRIQGTNEFAFIDVVVMNHGEGPRFNEVERHGNPVVLFDKDGVVTTATLDRGKHTREIRSRLAAIRISTRWGYSLVAKEIARGNLSTPSGSISVFA